MSQNQTDKKMASVTMQVLRCMLSNEFSDTLDLGLPFSVSVSVSDVC